MRSAAPSLQLRHKVTGSVSLAAVLLELGPQGSLTAELQGLLQARWREVGEPAFDQAVSQTAFGPTTFTAHAEVANITAGEALQRTAGSARASLAVSADAYAIVSPADDDTTTADVEAARAALASSIETAFVAALQRMAASVAVVTRGDLVLAKPASRSAPLPVLLDAAFTVEPWPTSDGAPAVTTCPSWTLEELLLITERELFASYERVLARLEGVMLEAIALQPYLSGLDKLTGHAQNIAGWCSVVVDTFRASQDAAVGAIAVVRTTSSTVNVNVQPLLRQLTSLLRQASASKCGVDLQFLEALVASLTDAAGIAAPVNATLDSSPARVHNLQHQVIWDLRTPATHPSSRKRLLSAASNGADEEQPFNGPQSRFTGMALVMPRDLGCLRNDWMGRPRVCRRLTGIGDLPTKTQLVGGVLLTSTRSGVAQRTPCAAPFAGRLAQMCTVERNKDGEIQDIGPRSVCASDASGHVQPSFGREPVSTAASSLYDADVDMSVCLACLNATLGDCRPLPCAGLDISRQTTCAYRHTTISRTWAEK